MFDLNVDTYEYISFDIFDTLIFRNVPKAHDVYDLIEAKYNSLHKNHQISDFKINRIKCENDCRLISNDREINLNDIYKKLICFYGRKVSNELKSIECEIEVMLCIPNPEIKKIFDYVKNNKKIIITSDMYLDKKVILKILENCGYVDYDKLYLSSDIGLTKANGEIFKFIINDLKCSPKNILHIGDNKTSDYLNPRKYKINSYKYNRDKSNYNFNNKLFCGLCQNKPNVNYFYDFGYSKLGPLLLGFIKWLKHNLDNDNVKKVFFFSRDGYLLKKAFDLYYGKYFDTCYFYTSRRALLIPSLYKSNIDNIILKKDTSVSLEELLKMLDLDLNEFKSEQYEFNTKMVNVDNNSHKNNISTMSLSLIKERIYKEYKSFLNYAKFMNFEDKLAVVDIGWNGNMQKYIESIFDRLKVYGYYIGLVPQSTLQNLYNMKGYIFDKKHGTNIFQIESSINSIFELLFTAPHGSIKKYNDEKKNFVEFCDYEFENTINDKNLDNLREGALQFINDYKIYDIYFQFDISLEDSINNILEFAVNPSKIDIKNWGDFQFLDNGIKYIAKPDNNIKYFFNPKKFIHDYKEAYWRYGFLLRSNVILGKIYKKVKLRR